MARTAVIDKRSPGLYSLLISHPDPPAAALTPRLCPLALAAGCEGAAAELSPGSCFISLILTARHCACVCWRARGDKGGRARGGAGDELHDEQEEILNGYSMLCMAMIKLVYLHSPD